MNYIKKVYSGRIGRKNYILGLLFVGFLLLLGVVALGFVAVYLDSYLSGIVFLLLYIALYVLCYFYVFSLYIRRLHDLNKSGWYVLLLLIPIINLYWFMLLLFKKGQDGENRYGFVNLDTKTVATTFKGVSNISQSV